MSKKLIYLIVLVVVVILTYVVFIGFQNSKKTTSTNSTSSTTGKTSSQTKKSSVANNQKIIIKETEKTTVDSNNIFTSSSPIANINSKKTITNLYNATGVDSTISSNTMYWTIVYNNDLLIEYSISGSGFKYSNKNGQVISDLIEKIEKYFSNNNFKEDMHNHGAATVKGSRGFQNKNIVCTVGRELISKDGSYSKIDGTSMSIVCGDIRNKTEVSRRKYE
jgi:hypothetical protein